PTSAISLSSSSRTRFSPGRPGPNWRGERLVLDLNRWLPHPPLPPRATSSVSPSWIRSPKTSPLSPSRTAVPTGQGTYRSSPPRPGQSLLPPGPPCFALKVRSIRKSTSVLIPSVALRNTLPPFPPSPPSGPPSGTNFSRRKLVLPRPPLPAVTFNRASSTNFIGYRNKNPGMCRGFCQIGQIRKPSGRLELF